MFRSRHAPHEQGLSLTEILVTIGIIALLFAIAVPFFLNQRKVSWQTAIQQDVSNAATYISQNKTSLGGYQSYTQNHATPVNSGIPGFQSSEGVELRVYGSTELGKDAACVEGFHTGNNPTKPAATSGSAIQQYHESRWHITVSSALNLTMPPAVEYRNGTQVTLPTERVGAVLVGPCQVGAGI